MRRFSIPITLLCLAGLTALIAACGGPPVESTSIDGAVRDISNWSIEWVGDTTVTVDDQAREALGLTASKYTLPEYCIDYVGEVKRALVRNHDFNFYVNLPVEGRLALKIYGQQRALFTNTRSDAAQLMNDLNKERGNRAMGPFDDDRARIMAESDLVRRVDIQVIGVDERVLGEIFVGGESGSTVKPEDVAKAIDEVLRSGGVVVDRTPG